MGLSCYLFSYLRTIFVLNYLPNIRKYPLSSYLILPRYNYMASTYNQTFYTSLNDQNFEHYEIKIVLQTVNRWSFSWIFTRDDAQIIMICCLYQNWKTRTTFIYGCNLTFVPLLCPRFSIRESSVRPSVLDVFVKLIAMHEKHMHRHCHHHHRRSHHHCGCHQLHNTLWPMSPFTSIAVAR